MFLDSYYEATEDLPEADAKLLYWALVRYAFTGGLVDLPPELSRLFKAFRPTIDSSIASYKNGKKGGRPRKRA